MSYQLYNATFFNYAHWLCDWLLKYLHYCEKKQRQENILIEIIKNLLKKDHTMQA